MPSFSRSWSLLLNIFSSVVGRSINLATTALIVPLSIDGLGPLQYGMLAVILSFSSLMTFSDLGLGLVFVNRISSRNALLDSDRLLFSRILALTGVFSVSLLTAIILLLWIAVGVGDPLRVGAIAPELMLAFACVCAGVPAGLAQRLQFAWNQTARASAWTAGGRLASLGGVLIAHQLGLPLAWYVFAVVGVPTMVTWLNFAFVMVGVPAIRPVFPGLEWRALGEDLKSGLQFFFLQTAVFLESGADTLIVGTAHGYEKAGSYDVLNRLYNYIPAMASIGAFPLWPALRRALADGDHLWFSRASRISLLLICLACGSAALVISVCQVEIIETWTGRAISLDPMLTLGLSLAAVLSSISMIQSITLNALGALRIQVRVTVLSIVVGLLLKVVLVSPFGPTGIALALAIQFSLKVTILAVYMRGRGIEVSHDHR